MQTEIAPARLLYRVLNNTAAIVGGDIAYRLLSFATTVLVARAIGGERYGEFSFIYTYLAFFETFVQFGFNAIITREVSRDKSRASALLGNALLARLGLIAVAIPAAIILIRVCGYPLSVQQGVWLASFQLLLTLRSIFEIIFRINLRMIYPVLWNLLSGVCNLALVWVVSVYHPTLPSLIFAYLAGGVIGLTGLAMHCKRLISLDMKPQWALIKRLFRESSPLVLSGFLTILFWRQDVLMLSKMRGFTDVGYYTVAARFADSLMIIATSLMASLFPIMSHAFHEDRERFDSIVSKALGVLAMIGIPMVALGSLVAKDVVVLFFGPAYAPAGATLAILLGYALCGFFSILMVNILIVCGKQVVDTWLSLTMVLINFGMNSFLIPSYGFNGAAVSLLVSETVYVGIVSVFLVKVTRLGSAAVWRELWLPLRINIFYIPMVLFIHYFVPNRIVFLCLAGALYAGFLFAGKVLRPKEVKDYLAYVLSPGR